ENPSLIFVPSSGLNAIDKSLEDFLSRTHEDFKRLWWSCQAKRGQGLTRRHFFGGADGRGFQ
ncbi:MAG TPA: hypothetical protein PL020_06980, partial [Candidatus Cloacimonadota bacterium]|nr:hypothetical protein [Candidatus Cloacimonadota bacterium]